MKLHAKAGRLHTRVDARLLEIAKREARERRVPLRAIVEGALRERYDPEVTKRHDMALLAELRNLRKEVHQVNFGNRVIVELFTLAIRNLFQRLPSPTEQSRAAGNGFCDALIASVEKAFVQDRPLLDKLAGSLLFSAGEFDMAKDSGESEMKPLT